MDVTWTRSLKKAEESYARQRVGGSAKLIVCAGPRFGVGGGYEKSYTESNFFSHHRFIEGSSNSTHKVATLSIPKLDVTKTTIAIGVVEDVVTPLLATMSLQ